MANASFYFLRFLRFYPFYCRVRQAGMGEKERGGHAAKDYVQESNPGRCDQD